MMDPSLTCVTRVPKQTNQKLYLEALFAEDCALMTHTESDLQHVVTKFAEAAQLFGLTISLGKTEVLHQPSPGTTVPSPTISEAQYPVMDP